MENESSNVRANSSKNSDPGVGSQTESQLPPTSPTSSNSSYLNLSPDTLKLIMELVTTMGNVSEYRRNFENIETSLKMLFA